MHAYIFAHSGTDRMFPKILIILNSLYFTLGQVLLMPLNFSSFRELVANC